MKKSNRFSGLIGMLIVAFFVGIFFPTPAVAQRLSPALEKAAQEEVLNLLMREAESSGLTAPQSASATMSPPPGTANYFGDVSIGDTMLQPISTSLFGNRTKVWKPTVAGTDHLQNLGLGPMTFYLTYWQTNMGINGTISISGTSRSELPTNDKIYHTWCLVGTTNGAPLGVINITGTVDVRGGNGFFNGWHGTLNVTGSTRAQGSPPLESNGRAWNLHYSGQVTIDPPVALNSKSPYPIYQQKVGMWYDWLLTPRGRSRHLC